MVPDVDSLIDGKGPEISVCDLRPMHSKVNHHATGNIENGLNVALNRNLVMWSNTREVSKLVLIFTISLSFKTTKMMVISNVFSDGDTVGSAKELSA